MNPSAAATRSARLCVTTTDRLQRRMAVFNHPASIPYLNLEVHAAKPLSFIRCDYSLFLHTLQVCAKKKKKKPNAYRQSVLDIPHVTLKHILIPMQVQLHKRTIGRPVVLLSGAQTATSSYQEEGATLANDRIQADSPKLMFQALNETRIETEKKNCVKFSKLQFFFPFLF